ncbi:MAG: hypothetical protein AB4372_23630 [Xenococcus sp. (in: cyanobacteria)]
MQSEPVSRKAKQSAVLRVFLSQERISIFKIGAAGMSLLPRTVYL